MDARRRRRDAERARERERQRSRKATMSETEKENVRESEDRWLMILKGRETGKGIGTEELRWMKLSVKGREREEKKI